MARFGAIVALGLSLLLAPSAWAEHRVALLIVNHNYEKPKRDIAKPDLVVLVKSLTARGFHCTTLRDLENEKAIRHAIETYAATTPTRGATLFYFHGLLTDDLRLQAIDSRTSFPLQAVMQLFSERGGSRRHLYYIDSAVKQTFTDTLPEASQLTFGGTDVLTRSLSQEGRLADAIASAGATVSNLLAGEPDQPSHAISSPDRFARGANPGDEWVNRMGLVFCWCPPGELVMGSPEDEPGRYPDEQRQSVRIEHGFWIAKYELALSQRIAARGPGKTIARHKLDPMTMINHDDARSMLRTYTEAERKAGRLPGDWEYALPSEKQWEYAARAGTSTRFSFGDNLNQLPRYANFADKSYYDSGDVFANSAHRILDDGSVRLARVGSYRANPWGLHDMHGNVAEWCRNYAIRGGSWTSVADNCRSAYRDRFSSRNEQNFIGYRLVIQPTAARDTPQGVR